MKVTVNIGLNNNPISMETIKTILKPSKLHSYRIDNGEYKNEIEPTFVGYINTATEYESVSECKRMFGEFLSLLCEVFTQECIAFKVEGEGSIAFNKNFKGDKIIFNNKYFLD